MVLAIGRSKDNDLLLDLAESIPMRHKLRFEEARMCPIEHISLAQEPITVASKSKKTHKKQ
jgi:hypothetical protein